MDSRREIGRAHKSDGTYFFVNDGTIGTRPTVAGGSKAPIFIGAGIVFVGVCAYVLLTGDHGTPGADASLPESDTTPDYERPETPEQQRERERLESIDNKDASGDGEWPEEVTASDQSESPTDGVDSQELDDSNDESDDTKAEETVERVGRRELRQMTDEKLADYAKRYINAEDIETRSELAPKHRALYDELRERNLLGEVFEKFYSEMNDQELTAAAKETIKEGGIQTRSELATKETGLYQELRERGLVGEVFEKFYSEMNNEEIIAYANKILDEDDIDTRSELAKKETGLHRELLKRNLLGEVFEKFYSEMNDQELIAHAKETMQEGGISKRKELIINDRELYDQLRERDLLGEVFERFYSEMGDRELLAEAQRVVTEQNIEKRSELATKESGLYHELLKRGLLDLVFGPKP